MTLAGDGVNAVRLGLLSALSSLDDATTGVYDSTLGGRAKKRRALIVATQIDIQPRPPERAAGRYGQTITITCHATVGQGSRGAPDRWDDIADLMNAIDTAIQSNQTLGGSCYGATLGDFQLIPALDANDASVEADLTITTWRDG